MACGPHPVDILFVSHAFLLVWDIWKWNVHLRTCICGPFTSVPLPSFLRYVAVCSFHVTET